MPDWHILVQRLKRENAVLRAELEELKALQAATEVLLDTAWTAAVVDHRPRPPEGRA
jgi:hypothetical protein